jgi:hypothetical protein
LFKQRLLVAALVVLVALSVLLTLTNVSAGMGGGGAHDLIRILL